MEEEGCQFVVEGQAEEEEEWLGAQRYWIEWEDIDI